MREKLHIEEEPTSEKDDLEQILRLILEKREGREKQREEVSLEQFPVSIREVIEEVVGIMMKWVGEQRAPTIGEVNKIREAILRLEGAHYIDARFGLPNKSAIKVAIQEEIDKLLGNRDVGVKDFKKMAKISFDLNGLKAVNDFNGGRHEMGDKYLKIVAEVFKDKETPIRRKLAGMGIKVTVACEGGDEFGVLLVGQKEISQDLIDEIIFEYKKMIGDLEASDLLDFSRDEVMSTLVGGRWDEMDEKERENGRRKRVPQDFKFKATISGGGTTLYEGFLESEEKPRPEDSFQRILEKLMGGVLDVSDLRAKVDKDRYKRMLRGSSNFNERFMAEIFARTDEMRKLLEEQEREGHEAMVRGLLPKVKM